MSDNANIESVKAEDLEGLGKKNYPAILNNIGDPVFVKDEHSRLVLVNDAFCELFGRSRKEVIGKTLAEDVAPEEREHFLKVDRQVILDGKESIIEESLTIRGGQTRTISTRKTRFIDERGRKFLIGIIRDITEVKQAEELGRLNDLNEILLSAAQVLTQPSKRPTDVLRDLTELISKQFNAVCDVSVLDRSNEIIRPIAIYHKDREVRETIETLFNITEVKAGEGLVGSVIETGDEMVLKDVPEWMKKGPAKVNQKIVPVSMIYVPIRGSVGVLGSLNLTRIGQADKFSKNDLTQIRKIGQYISVFVENILLQKEREEIADIRKQDELRLASDKLWTDFKLDVSALLADVETELEDVLQKLCEKITDFFDVVSDFQLLDQEREVIRLVALHHHDKKVKAAIEEVLVTPQLKVGVGMVGKVVETGKEFYIKELSEELKRKVAEEKVNPLIVPSSFVYLPLRSNGKTLGTLDLTRLHHQPAISENELVRMRDLADYAARFIENRLLQIAQEKEIALRKKTEQKLERSTKLLERIEAETRQMLNAIPVYIMRVSRNFRFVFLNDYHENIGIEPRAWEGKYVQDLIGKKMFNRTLPDYERALNGEVFNGEIVSTIDGEQHYFNVALAPDYSESGEVVGFYACATDMTDKVEAEREVKLTQERFESLSLNSGDAFFFHDQDQNILDVNQVASDMLGYSREELLKMKAADIDPRWKQDMYQRYLGELGVNDPQTFDTQVFAKDGRQIPVEVRFVKREEDGKVYIQSLLRDRTEKREREERLQRSEQNLRLIFDNVEDFIATISENGIVESVNKTTQGVLVEDVVGASVFDWYPDPEIRKSVEAGFERLRTTGEGFDVETTAYEGPDGSVKQYYNKYIAKFQEGRFYKAILIIRDITGERSRARSVMNAALKGQEQERKRLGAELHDGIGQVLSAIALQVSRIREASESNKLESLNENLLSLSDNLQAAIKEVRNISHDLMPEVLESFGLKEAINQTCSNLQDRTGLNVTFNHVDLEPRYDPTIEVNLFRITQELLNNVHKHARSKNVFVNLMDHGDVLSLTVEDDGVGFVESNNSNGIGLKNVKSRVSMINGNIDMESSENSGTLVNIEVPKEAK